jgi:hypothetical protein
MAPIKGLLQPLSSLLCNKMAYLDVQKLTGRHATTFVINANCRGNAG